MTNSDAITMLNVEETYPANVYFFKVSNRNIRKRCEIC